jgi:hypothetical protein
MNLPVPKSNGPAVRLPAEVVRENIRTVLQQQPDLVSYDPSTDDGELLSLRCAVDPGVPATARDGWRNTVVHWGVAAYEVADEKTAEVLLLPSLALIAEDGDLVRLTGWPAIKSWSRIVQALGRERCQLGVKIKVVRRASGTAGRSYWLVLPDA